MAELTPPRKPRQNFPEEFSEFLRTSPLEFLKKFQRVVENFDALGGMVVRIGTRIFQ